MKRKSKFKYQKCDTAKSTIAELCANGCAIVHFNCNSAKNVEYGLLRAIKSGLVGDEKRITLLDHHGGVEYCIINELQLGLDGVSGQMDVSLIKDESACDDNLSAYRVTVESIVRAIKALDDCDFAKVKEFVLIKCAEDYNNVGGNDE